MADRERMSPADTTWLRMDRPTNPMVIVGVLVLQGPVDISRLEQTLANRLLAFPRFGQHVEHRAFQYWWVTNSIFTTERHIKRLRLPGRADRSELERLVDRLASEQLDISRPLWDFHIVEDYDGGAAIVVRIHHAIADGVALMGVLLSLTDRTPDPACGEPYQRSGQVGQSDAAQWAKSLAKYIGLIDEGVALSREVYEEVRERLGRPTETLQEGFDIAGEMAHLLLMPGDSNTRFKGRPSGQKRTSWTDPIALPEVKIVSKVLGCSVNDMLLAAVAGSLRSYLEDKGDDVQGTEIRAIVPVNLRPTTSSSELGNHFGVVALELPIGTENPLQRLYEIHRRMEALKATNEAPVTLGLISALGYAPGAVQQRFFDLLLSRASAVMSNVPGPQHALYLAGARVRQLMFWVPQASDIALGISVLSFDGHVQFGVMTDTAVIEDPEKIVERFAPEFEQLLYYVLMQPWDASVVPSDARRPIRRPRTNSTRKAAVKGAFPK